MKKYLVYIFFIGLLVITYFTYNKKEEVIIIEKDEIIKETSEVINKIKVDVKGAVRNPGVYELEEGKRVVDAIIKSGGTIKGAKTDTLNLSKLLTDQMVIYVYKFEEEKQVCQPIIECPIIDCEVVSNDACIEEEITKISINTASLEELQTLTGIGESKAQDIINYRNINKFLTIEDIMKVTGIGESTFNKIKDFIKV
jgi:competence protein ComEA